MSRNFTILGVTREALHARATVHYNDRSLLEVSAEEILCTFQARRNVEPSTAHFSLRVDGVYDAECFSGQVLLNNHWHTFHVTPHPKDENVALLTIYT